MILKYEKLPLFCFRCGCVIHGIKGCPIRSQKRMSEGDEGKDWGVWLRVEVPKKRGQFWPSSGGGSSFSEDQVTEVGRQSLVRQNQIFNSGFHGITSHSKQPTKPASSGESGMWQSGEDDGGIQNSNSDLAIKVSGKKTVVMEGQKQKEKGVVSGGLIGVGIVGSRSNGFVLRDKVSGSDIVMPGGDLFKSNVVLHNTTEGQDGLMPLTHKMTMEGPSGSARMDVELNSRGLDLDDDNFLHTSEVISLAQEVNMGKIGVEGASIGSSNIK